MYEIPYDAVHLATVLRRAMTSQFLFLRQLSSDVYNTSLKQKHLDVRGTSFQRKLLKIMQSYVITRSFTDNCAASRKYWYFSLEYSLSTYVPNHRRHLPVTLMLQTRKDATLPCVRKLTNWNMCVQHCNKLKINSIDLDIEIRVLNHQIQHSTKQRAKYHHKITSFQTLQNLKKKKSKHKRIHERTGNLTYKLYLLSNSTRKKNKNRYQKQNLARQAFHHT